MPCSAGVAWRRSGPLRKALEVIEARCSDDISSPPRCRPIPPDSRPRRNTIVTIPNRGWRATSALLPTPRGCVDRVAVCAHVCLRVCICNKCVRARAPASSQEYRIACRTPREAPLAKLRDFANLTIAKSIADIRYWRSKWNQFRKRCGIPASSAITCARQCG